MLTMRTVVLSLLVLNVGAQTATQPSEPASPKATAIRPHVVIETVGPDGWRARLGPTNVGSMLASKEGHDLWQPQLTPLLGMWRQLAGDEANFTAASERLFAFDGSIRIAMLFDVGGPTGRTNVALVLQDNGETDLPAMAKDLHQLLERGLAGRWQDVTVAGETVQMRIDGSDAVSAPIVEGGHLMLLLGQRDDMDRSMALAAHLVALPPTIDKPTPGSPALHVQFDMQAIFDDTGTFEGRDGAFGKALGLDSLGMLDVTLRAAGPRVALDLAMTFGSENRGLLGAFMPASQGISSLFRLLPDETAAWKVGRFDFEALFESIVNAVEEAPFWGSEPTKVRKEMQDEFGIDVGKDLLAHMTDEVLVIGSPFQDFDRASEATWLLAFRLADQAKFAPAMETMLKQVKPWLSSAETIAVDDVQLRRYSNMFSYDVWMATGNGLFVIAGGRDGEEHATAILTKAATGDLQPPTGQEPWFEGLSRYVPAGLNGIARFDLDSIAGIPVEWWFEIVQEMMPPGSDMDPDAAEQSQQNFRTLLRQHGLSTMRTATGYADARFVWRLFW